MLVLLDIPEATCLAGGHRKGESARAPRFSASSCALRLLMPPIEEIGLSAGLLVTLGKPETAGPRRGVAAAEKSDSSPPDVTGVWKPREMLAAGAIPSKAFFFFFL